MNYATDLAIEMKKRNNVKRIGNLVGEVLSLSPLKIGILGNEVMLDSTNCFVCNNLKEQIERKATLKIDGYTTGDANGAITFKEILKIGDKVLAISDAEGQYFFIVDKIEVI